MTNNKEANMVKRAISKRGHANEGMILTRLESISEDKPHNYKSHEIALAKELVESGLSNRVIDKHPKRTLSLFIKANLMYLY